MTRAALLSVLIAIGASGCSVLTARLRENQDHLLGWYRLENRDAIIPVFKAEGDYYTVSGRGVEIPLKPCAEGLEWAVTPSSMAGTKIIYDNQSDNPYYISVKDAIAAHMGLGEEEAWRVTGEKRRLIKIDKPSGLPDPTTRPPRNIEDFLGWYVFAWSPRLGVEIRKDGEKYMATLQSMAEPGQWKAAGDPHEIEIAPLPDRRGLTFLDPDTDINLIYNTARKRFELAANAEDTSPLIFHIPLVRVAPEAFSQSHAAPIATMAIGIPSWD